MPSELLRTERLVLREFEMSDLEGLCELDSDPRVRRFLADGKPVPCEVTGAETLPAMLQSYQSHPGFGTWAAVERDTDDFLGWFALNPTEGVSEREAELGYRLRSPSWGKGFATEGARALIRLGFTELGLQRIVAFTMTVNTGSRRVMEKCGLSFVRTFFLDWPGDPIEGSELGDVEYAMDRSTYWKVSHSGSAGNIGRNVK